MNHVQDKKDALATLVEIERQNLQESIEALRGVAQYEVEEIKERVEHIVHKLDVRSAIVEHRYKVLLGVFAIGIALGVRRALND